MSFRIATLLCLSGLAACSNTTTEPAEAPRATNDADTAMRPASFEADGVRDEQRNPDGTPVTGDSAPVGAGMQAPTPAPAAGTEPAGTSTAPAPTTELAPRDPATQPDNTKVNERDRNTAALTPGDQGNNQSDLDITQRIRKSVMANDSLSFTAKNVKIITTGGKVTLRGPVKTEQEREAIVAAARQVVGTAQIDNQIEVKK